MAAKIFAHSENIKKPALIVQTWEEYEKNVDAYLEEVKKEMTEIYKPKPTEKYFGEVIKLQYADGYAKYMVVSLRPLILIHLQIDDEWDSDMADLLTAKKVVEMIESERRIKEMFEKRKQTRNL